MRVYHELYRDASVDCYNSIMRDCFFFSFFSLFFLLSIEEYMACISFLLSLPTLLDKKSVDIHRRK